MILFVVVYWCKIERLAPQLMMPRSCLSTTIGDGGEEWRWVVVDLAMQTILRDGLQSNPDGSPRAESCDNHSFFLSRLLKESLKDEQIA